MPAHQHRNRHKHHHQELLGIEARRQRNWLNSGAMRGELLATFGELESVVRDGRAAVLREQKRQQVRVCGCGMVTPARRSSRTSKANKHTPHHLTQPEQHVRDANLKALAMVLDETRREQNAWVDKRLAAERRAMAAEEKAFAALIARAEAEAECASHLAALTYRSRGAVVCQELSDHSPDFRFLSSHVNDCMQVGGCGVRACVRPRFAVDTRSHQVASAVPATRV